MYGHGRGARADGSRDRPRGRRSEGDERDHPISG